MRNLLIGLMLTTWLTGAPLAQAQSVSDEELDDVRAIINAKNGTIKRWERTPSVVVIHDHPMPGDVFAPTLELIQRATQLDMPAPQFIDLAQNFMPDRFYSDTRFRLDLMQDGYRNHMVIGGGSADPLDAQIFVFFLSPQIASHFMILTSVGHRNLSLQRQYLQGEGPCFYATASNSGGMINGMIFISPTEAADFVEDCIYEELVQAMGLVNDADDTPWFTFDNLPGAKPRIHDERLLRALYDPRVSTGSSVDEVVQIYEALSAEVATASLD
jgi:hypothetical protein